MTETSSFSVSCLYHKCVALGCELGSLLLACTKEVNIIHWFARVLK